MLRVILFSVYIVLQFLGNTVQAVVPDWEPGSIAAQQQLCIPGPSSIIQNIQPATPPAGYSVTYQWKMSSNPLATLPGFTGWQIISGANQQNCPSIQIAQTTYFVRLARIKRCKLVQDSAYSNISLALFGTPIARVTTSYATNICAGDSILLNADCPAGSVVTWNNGATGQMIYVNVSGYYSYQFSNPNGCSGISSNILKVNVGSLPTDLNLDGITNHDDFLILNGGLFLPCPVSNCPGDFNADGLVDNYDFLIFIRDYNRSCASSVTSGF